MPRWSIFRFTAVAAIVFGLLPNAAMSQQMLLKQQLIGAWTYESSTAKLPDGSPLWGTNPRGLMIFTEDGHYSWQIFRSDRPKLMSMNRMRGTPEENAAILQGSLAYFGTYSVDEASKTIATVVEGSTFPNSEGELLKRIVTRVSADTLTYENPATTQGERIEAVWRRIK